MSSTSSSCAKIPGDFANWQAKVKPHDTLTQLNMLRDSDTTNKNCSVCFHERVTAAEPVVWITHISVFCGQLRQSCWKRQPSPEAWPHSVCCFQSQNPGSFLETSFQELMYLSSARRHSAHLENQQKLPRSMKSRSQANHLDQLDLVCCVVAHSDVCRVKIAPQNIQGLSSMSFSARTKFLE